MKRPLRALVVNDLHIPLHDEGLVELVMFKIGKKIKPDVIFLNGDIIDNFSISRYEKHPSIRLGLDQEISAVRTFLQRLRATYPKARIVYIWGNHEFRFDTYITENASELYGLVHLDKLLGCQELGIEVVKSVYRENWYRWGDLYIGHFDTCGTLAGSTAQKLLRSKGVSVLQGHVHRCGASSIALMDRTLYAYENGTLCDVSKQTYAKKPDWSASFAIVYLVKGRAHVQLYPLKNGQTVYDGVLYHAYPSRDRRSSSAGSNRKPKKV